MPRKITDHITAVGRRKGLVIDEDFGNVPVELGAAVEPAPDAQWTDIGGIGQSDAAAVVCKAEVMSHHAVAAGDLHAQGGELAQNGSRGTAAGAGIENPIAAVAERQACSGVEPPVDRPRKAGAAALAPNMLPQGGIAADKPGHSIGGEIVGQESRRLVRDFEETIGAVKMQGRLAIEGIGQNCGGGSIHRVGWRYYRCLTDRSSSARPRPGWW